MKIQDVNNLKGKLNEHGIHVGILPQTIRREIDILESKRKRLRAYKRRGGNLELILEIQEIDHKILMLVIKGIDNGFDCLARDIH
jgi:hypothetical protein